MTDVQTRTGAEQHEEPIAGGAAPTRRAVLAGAGGLGATCLLTACGTDTAGTATPEPPAGSAAPATGSTAATGTGSGGAPLALVADVPQGGGIITGKYVITQPSEGTFKAFDKICTHQGCPVTKVDGATINCACHNSSFSIEDGSVQGGPAKKPLPEIQVKVEGDNIVAA